MADHDLHPLEAAERQRTFILWVLRAVFLLLVLAVSLLPLIRNETEAGENDPFPIWTLVVAAAGMFFAAIAVDILTPNKKASTLAGALVGVLAGLLATLALAFIIDLAVEAWVGNKDTLDRMEGPLRTLKIMLGATFCYLGVSTVLQTKDDFRLLIPYVEFSKSLRGPRPLLIDSSVLIDARLADVGATGIIQAPIVIPRFVIGELQLLADSNEKMKRTRGRRGLDLVTRLQRTPGLDVTIDETQVAAKSVDSMLIELARRMSGVIVTTDTGLNRVAQIQDVPVLNINDLANALKPALAPGERLHIHIMRRGEQEGQGVGYLDDGTMVVVEGGAERLNEIAEVEVTSTLQTSAGRMIFARRVLTEEPSGAVASPPALPAASSEARSNHGDAVDPDPAETLAAADRANGHAADAAADSGQPSGLRAASDPDQKRDGPFPPNRARRGGTARNPRR